MSQNKLNELVKIAEMVYSLAGGYFNYLEDIGLKDKLYDDFYILTVDMPVSYKNFFIQSMKKKLNESLYKDIDITKADDRDLLKKDQDIQDYLDKLISIPQKRLVPKKEKLIKFLKNHEQDEIALEDVMIAVKLNRVDTLLLLKMVKDSPNSIVYDFNGREVTKK